MSDVMEKATIPCVDPLVIYAPKSTWGAKTDILVPTCKRRAQLGSFFEEVIRMSLSFRLIVSAEPALSAAQNRNRCLDASLAEYVIMMDDDISGLSPNWNIELIRQVEANSTVALVSARLLRGDGTPGPMMSSKKDLSGPLEEVPKVPTACVAFRRTDYRFDENFKGSGFEDDAFCLHMATQGRIVIDNRVRVVHANEMKHQQEHWAHNQAYFDHRYGSKKGGTT